MNFNQYEEKRRRITRQSRKITRGYRRFARKSRRITHRGLKGLDKHKGEKLPGWGIFAFLVELILTIFI